MGGDEPLILISHDSRSSDAVANPYIALSGPRSFDAEFSLNIIAKIGPLKKNILSMSRIKALANSTEYIYVDLESALGIHPMQFEYVTKIVATVDMHTENGDFRKILPSRYLALNSFDETIEFMDLDVREVRYPFGFTTAKGQEKALAISGEALAQGEYLEDTGPGLYRTERSNRPSDEYPYEEESR